jgi:8-oxo-dGTP pyrophosphatase MutT (NUDIX family)
MHCSIDEVRAALSLPDYDGFAAQRRMAPSSRPVGRFESRPGEPRLGGVLMLLYCVNDEVMLVLIRRPDYNGVHSGQVSCPGGRHEPPESLETTALRETYEEVGIRPEEVVVLGQLTTLYIPPSDFEVHPFVGYFSAGRPAFVPDSREVAEIIEVSLADLLDPATRVEEVWELRGVEVLVPFYQISGQKVWGATAMMLSELVERIHYVNARLFNGRADSL